MSNSHYIIKQLAEFLQDFKTRYIKAHNNNFLFKEVVFAGEMLAGLKNNQNLLAYLSSTLRQELADSLIVHKERYTRLLTTSNTPEEQIKDCKVIMNVLGTELTRQILETEKISKIEKDIIDLIDNIFKKIQTIFAERTYTVDTISDLLALSITLNLPHLELKEQYALAKQLLLVKELWTFSFKKRKILSNDHPMYKFLIHTYQILELENDHNLDQTFAKMINYLVKQQDILENLSDKELLTLYDRLKDYEWKSDLILILLTNIHSEAQFRYSYNRLSDSGYELLKRLQNFDAILHHIDSMEYTILESYLLRKNTLIDEIIFTLAKQVDNIKALNITKCPELTSLISSINTALRKKTPPENATIALLSSIKSKLDKNLENHIKKRYTELDKYLVKSLQDKYKLLCYNIQSLIEEKGDYQNYLGRIFAAKLAMDYYIPNLSSSVPKLRAITKDREHIISLVSELHIEQIFNLRHQNKIMSLNFRKKLTEADLKSPIDYISGIIREVVILCNASQLEVLYTPLLTGKLSKVQMILKNQISNQIHQRISIRQMLYSVFLGRKREYDKLTEIKKNIKQLQPQKVYSIEELDLQTTSHNGATEIKNDSSG